MPTLRTVTAWIATARRDFGQRPWQRAATVHQHVLLVLRWMRHHAALSDLGHDARISIATAYRCLHEALDVIAAHVPNLHDVPGRHPRPRTGLPLPGWHPRPRRPGRRAYRAGQQHLVIGQEPPVQRQHPSDLRPQRAPVVGLADAPGLVQDLRCARELVLPTLYPFCRLRPDGHSYPPALADKGYIGAGIGVPVPH